MNYRDPIVDAYLSLFKEVLGDNVREYYHGDPLRIPNTALPALIVRKVGTDITRDSTASCSNSVDMEVIIVTSILNDVQSEDDVAPGTCTLYEILEGRNLNGQVLDESVLGALQKNIRVGGICMTNQNKLKINYGMVLDKRAPEALSIEGTLAFNAIIY